MTKGNQGESCAEAIRSSLKSGEIVTFSELYRRVKQRGSWKEETVWQHMMGLIINLPPARHHWKGMNPFLFLHGDGRYELYNPARHPKVVE
ncbi:MAG: hypothetical protein MUO77_20370 [Anaerolineales bacterium]|jgi:hypothetical protein|nr:hypothetical protein [Anaerolineales bacterium]